MTFDEWCNALERKDEDCIYSDDPIFEWAKLAGLPREYVAIAWTQFGERFGGSDKVQRDWRATFRNYVRQGWLNCWRTTPDGYVLTTVGEQARRVRENLNLESR
ncbi:hypothetical protein SAMN05216289_10377 [Dokdonella immobilis]|uniref:Uncharacterized protein n=2 Tax=Dokdonella immobilis TaxID=578942 RepID=A0A1I4VV03_9GAMM|nr:hypothetical protein SAMN05216289_10377 [Dokdonella immobilis]